MEDPTIKGHPELELPDSLGGGQSVFITVCAECGAMKSVLWLDGDRWYCRVCRNTGSARPTMVPVSMPRHK